MLYFIWAMVEFILVGSPDEWAAAGRACGDELVVCLFFSLIYSSLYFYILSTVLRISSFTLSLYRLWLFAWNTQHALPLSSWLNRVKSHFYLPLPSETKVSPPFRRETLITSLKTLFLKPLGSRFSHPRQTTDLLARSLGFLTFNNKCWYHHKLK